MKSRRAAVRVALAAVAAIVLLAVFGAYQRPEMAMTIATQLWNCF